MGIVEVREVRIGEGIPKICVSLMGETAEALREEAVQVKEAGADLAEWRVDWFSDWEKPEAIQEALKQIRDGLGEVPLLVTFRTKQEGGNSEIDQDQYFDLYRRVMDSGNADLIDLELFFGENVIRDLIRCAAEKDVKTVLSNHDFEKTPDLQEILERLKAMEDLGADIAKIAVMPQTAKDVSKLLLATTESVEQLSCPVITMSMGGKGTVTRMAGQIFGSAVTFAALKTASAPGQVPLDQLKEVLKLVDSLQ